MPHGKTALTWISLLSEDLVQARPTSSEVSDSLASGARSDRGSAALGLRRRLALVARGALPLGIGVVLVLLSVACFRHDTTPPNVVIIVIDTLRADHLEHFGYHRRTAPDLDEFVSNAAVFTNCRAPASWTCPSVASVMTGLLPARHGASEFGATLPAEHLTLAEALKSAGYHTAAISFNPGVRSELQFDQGFDEFDEYLGKTAHYPDVSEMLDRLETWLDAKPPQPFFLYLQPMNVHGPYRVPQEHRADLLGRAPSREFRYWGETMRRVLRRRDQDLTVRDRIPESFRQSLIDQYDTAIHYTTGVTADMLKALEQRGLLDPSLVIITADHGEELLDHGGFSHGYSLYDEVLHVPLYLKLPHQSRHATVDRAVTLMDIYPTVLDAVGLSTNTDLDGTSLAPLVTGGGEGSERESRLFEGRWQGRCIARSLEVDGYKVIEIEQNYEGLRGVVQLFNLEADPDERVDLAGEQPQRSESLQSRLAVLFDEAIARQVGKSENRVDDLDQERMRALGYIE